MDFTEKIGPLPVYAWGGILGVGVIGLSYMRSSTKSAAGAAQVDTGAYTAVSDEATGFPILGPGTVNTASTSQVSQPQAAEFASNLAWATKAIIGLSIQGESPLTIQIALEDYLAGNPLTEKQQKIVNAALVKYGSPPDGTAGTPILASATATAADPVTAVTPAASGVVNPVAVDYRNDPTAVGYMPPTQSGFTQLYPNGATLAQIFPGIAAEQPKQTYVAPVAAAPVHASSYTTVAGDTLPGVARMFYGDASFVILQKIARANGLSANMGALPAGKTLSLPS